MDGSEVDLCWDTGAAMSVFDASTNLLPKQEVFLYWLKVYSKSFDQGDNTIPFAAIGMHSDIFNTVGVSGFIGGNVYEGNLVIFDFPGRTVTLTNRRLDEFLSEGAYRFRFEVVDHVPIIKISVGGKQFVAEIDTGSDGLVNFGSMETIPYTDRAEFRGDLGWDVFGKRDSMAETKVRSIEVLGERVSDVVLDDRFGRYHTTAADGTKITNVADRFDASIGLKFLENGVLVLDYRTKQGFWKRHQGVLFPNYIAPFLCAADGKIVAVNVSLKDNPFHIGDRVLKVGGEPFSVVDSHIVNNRVELLRDGTVMTIEPTW